MEKEKVALFVGRFQPFHLGHLTVVDQMEDAPDVGKILIGIGSAQEVNTYDNPFSYQERARMIRETLEERLDKPFQIFPIQDVHNDAKWKRLVDLLIPEKFSVVYTGNPWVERILKGDGIEIREPVCNPDLACGTEIRELMKKGEEWEDFVPDKVIAVLKEIGGVERITGKGSRRLTPAVTADIIINWRNEGVVLIQRKEKLGDPNSLKWAIPGGHVDYGKEAVEQTAMREAKEETGLDLVITQEDQFRQYSDPDRDPRGHYVTMVYHKLVWGGELEAGDDAADIMVFPWDKIPSNLAFDHNRFLKDYIRTFLFTKVIDLSKNSALRRRASLWGLR